MIKKFFTIFLVAVLFLGTISGCATNTSAGSDSGASALGSLASTDSKVKPFKMGFTVWSTADGHGRYVAEATKWAVEAAGGELMVDVASAFSPEAQITSVENLIQGGCDIISLCAYMGEAIMPKISKSCEENGVYFVLWDTDISDPEILKMLEANPYYVGNTNEDQFQSAYEGMLYLADQGVTDLVICTYGVGIATADQREAGVRKAAQERNVNVLYRIVAPEDGKKAMQDVLVSYPQANGLFLLGGTENWLPPMLRAVEETKLAHPFYSASFDFADAMGELIDQDKLQIIFGGHVVTSTFAAMMAINAYNGTSLSDKAYRIEIPYLSVTNTEQVEIYNNFVIGSTPPYSTDELRQFLKAYNPDLTVETLQEMADAYSLENIQARNQ